MQLLPTQKLNLHNLKMRSSSLQCLCVEYLLMLQNNRIQQSTNFAAWHLVEKQRNKWNTDNNTFTVIVFLPISFDYSHQLASTDKVSFGLCSFIFYLHFLSFMLQFNVLFSLFSLCYTYLLKWHIHTSVQYVCTLMLKTTFILCNEY